MTNPIEKKKMQTIFLLCLVVVFSVAYIALCFSNTIWLDEAFTGIYVRQGWGELLYTTSQDVHPPLYYLIVKAFTMLLGDAIWVIKVVSVIPFLLCLILGVTVVRKEWGSKIAFLFLIFLSLTPCAVTKNIEMRMYSWAMFFVLAFALFAYRIIKEPNSKFMYWAGLILCGLAAAYTHYFALVSVGIFYGLLFGVCLLQRQKGKILRIVVCGIASGIGYFPWLRVFYGQTRNVAGGGWWLQTVPTLKEIPNYIMWPFREGSHFMGVLFMALLILGTGILIYRLVEDCKNKKMDYGIIIALLSIGTYVLTITAGVVLSILLKPLYLDRYIYSSLGILLLGLSVGLSCYKKKIGIIICFISCVIFLFAGVKEYQEVWQHQYDTESTEQVKNFMEATAGEDSLYVFDNQSIGMTLQYFYPEMQIIPDKVADLQVTKGIQGKTVYYMVADTELSLEELNRDNENTTIEYIQDGQLSNVNFRIYKIE